MAQVVLRRELNYCVVDEGDSVLIDEARAPLAISGKTNFGYLSAHLGCISGRVPLLISSYLPLSPPISRRACPS